jgi:hypothetical protein
MNCIVKVNKFLNNGEPKLDKHGKESVYLEPIVGQFPKSRNVMNGTIAERLGLELNKLYMLTITEKEEHEIYGRQFEYKLLSEINPLSLLNQDLSVEYISTSSPITTNFTQNEKAANVPF